MIQKSCCSMGKEKHITSHLKGDINMKDVMIVTGAGQIGMAIARRVGYG